MQRVPAITFYMFYFPPFKLQNKVVLQPSLRKKQRVLDNDDRPCFYRPTVGIVTFWVKNAILTPAANEASKPSADLDYRLWGLTSPSQSASERMSFHAPWSVRDNRIISSSFPSLLFVVCGLCVVWLVGLLLT